MSSLAQVGSVMDLQHAALNVPQASPESRVTRSGPVHRSVLPYVLTYAIVFVFLFFVMGGYLPAPSARVSSVQATTSGADTIFGQLFQAGTWALGLALMFRYRVCILRLAEQMKVFSALAILGIASAKWSQDPSNSFRRGIFLTLGTMFTFYLMRRFTIAQLAQITVITGVVGGLLGIAVSIALPSYGRDMFNGGAWQGIFRSKNGCAQLMLFFFSAAACFRFPSPGMRRMRRLLFPITMLLIVMAKAATAYMLLPLLLGVAAFFKALRRYERRNAIFIVVSVGALLAVAGLAMPYIMPLLLGMLGKDPEMSGRLPLWKAVIASASKRPWLGYGYCAFWTGLRGESLNVYMTTHFEIYQAQNGILELWLELGIVGVVLMLFTLMRATIDVFICLQEGYSPETTWFICLIALTVVYNVDETFLVSAHSLPWLLYVVACVGLRDRVLRIQAGRKLYERASSQSFSSWVPGIVA